MLALPLFFYMDYVYRFRNFNLVYSCFSIVIYNKAMVVSLFK